MNKQREALKLALDALESDNQDIMLRAGIAIREALSEPEQEPVAWMLMNDTHCHIMATDWKPEDSDGWKTAPLYTAPPARKPLTDNTLWEMWVESPSDVMRFARAIERAHGIGEA